MMTTNDIEESLSRAYVFAIAGRAGVNISGPIKDYGVDGTFKRIVIFNGMRIENGFPIDFQLKASIGCSFEPEYVVYDMEAPAYQKCVYRNLHGTAPYLLILLALPDDSDQWISHSEDALLLRQCCYWYRAEGDFTDNSRSIRIRIPRSQQLTPDTLNDLLARVAEGVF